MYIVITEQNGAFQVTEEVVTVVRIADFAIPSGITVSAFTAEGQILVGTGAGTYVAKSPGANGLYLKYDSEAIGGVTADTPAVDIEDTTNHLYNGGFRLAERQAPGTLTTIANGGYSADRWKINRENADLQYIRQDGSSESGLVSAYYGQFKKITNAGKFLLCQPLEYIDTLKFRGRALNFQLQMKAGAAKTIKIAIVELQAAGTADTLPTLVSSWNADSTDPTLGANLVAIDTPVSCSVTTAWQTFQFTGTLPTTSKNIMVMVWTDADFAANDTLSLAEAGLYLGTTLRSWTPRMLGQELSLCQRYYVKTFSVDVLPAQNTDKLGMCLAMVGKAGASANVGWYLFPVVMRTTPITVTFFNPYAANAEARCVSAAADCTSTAVWTVPTSQREIAFTCTGPAGAAVGDTIAVHFTAEAEL